MIGHCPNYSQLPSFNDFDPVLCVVCRQLCSFRIVYLLVCLQQVVNSPINYYRMISIQWTLLFLVDVTKALFSEVSIVSNSYALAQQCHCHCQTASQTSATRERCKLT